MARIHFNNFVTTLNEGGVLTDSASSITLTDSLPTIGSGNYVLLTIDDGSNIEIIRIDSNSGAPTYSCTRAQEGTSGTEFADGTAVECRITAASVDDIPNAKAHAGTGNTALGEGAGAALASGGSYNTFYGYEAGNDLTTGDYHCGFGYQALDNYTASAGAINTGNVAFGSAALGSLTSGTGNVGIGAYAGVSFGSTTDAIAIGRQAANGKTTYNICIGANSMSDGTSTRTNCIAIGYEAHRFGTGSNCVIIGEGVAGRQNGNNCVAVGYQAGINNTGTDNVHIGYGAGNGDSSGNNNVLIGSGTSKASATDSNTVTLGNSSIATLRCQQTSITALSDARDKKDIEDLNLGLSFIQSLRPVKFTWNQRDGKRIGQKEAGFIAQELREASKESSAEWMGLVYEANPEKLEAAPGKLLPVLVKAIQELSYRLEAAERKLAEKE